MDDRVNQLDLFSRFLDQKLLFHNAIVLSNNNIIKQSIFDEGHLTTFGGHSGQKGIISHITRSFYWQGLIKYIKKWIKECAVCQLAKSPTTKPYDLPMDVWEKLMIDFITNFPLSYGKSLIMVIVNRLSKGARFIPLYSPITAQSITNNFSREIIRLHGFPRLILKSHDPIFLGNFWRSLF